MTTKTTPSRKTYEPQELKTLFEALNSAPSYLSKRYILKHMLGWSDDDLRQNMTMIEEEQQQKRMGKTGGY
jgi:hypothetical protein